MIDDRRVVSIQPVSAVPPSVLLHVFTDSGVRYEVRFRKIDGQSVAALFIGSSTHGRPLLPLLDDLPSSVSARASRAGYIGVAEWLVKTGRWPDAETKSLYASEGLRALAA